MASLVCERKEVNRFAIHFVTDVIRERFCAATWKTMRSNVVASTPSYYFAHLTSDTLA
jgi:hypothetical protein